MQPFPMSSIVIFFALPFWLDFRSLFGLALRSSRLFGGPSDLFYSQVVRTRYGIVP